MTWSQARQEARSGRRVRRAPWIGRWVELRQWFWWIILADPQTFTDISAIVVRAGDLSAADLLATDWTTDPWQVAPSQHDDGILWPVRVWQTGGIGATGAYNYCGIHYERGPLATFHSPEDPPVVLTSDGVNPGNGHGSIELLAFDAYALRVWSGRTSNGVFQPDGTVSGPYSYVPSEITVDPRDFTPVAPCVALPSPPWCGCGFALIQ
jgi:hypothetical protein